MGSMGSTETKAESDKCFVCCTNHVMRQPAYFCTKVSYPCEKAKQISIDFNRELPHGAFLVKDRGLWTKWPTRFPWGTLIQCDIIENTTQRIAADRQQLEATLKLLDDKTKQRGDNPTFELVDDGKSNQPGDPSTFRPELLAYLREPFVNRSKMPPAK